MRALEGTFKAILVPRNIVDTFSGRWWMCAVTAVRGDMSKLGARRVNCGGKYRPGQGAEGVMSHNAGVGADIQSVLCDLWIKLWTIALVRSPDI